MIRLILNPKKKKVRNRKHTAKIESTGGEAKTSPQMEAVSIPSPTNPACAGSCPLPPPASQIISNKKMPVYCFHNFICQKGFLRETI